MPIAFSKQWVTSRTRRIFLSYRRKDTQSATQLICNHLAKEFGKKNVFMDVDSLEPGEKWKLGLETQLAHSDVFLVIIGHDWVGRAETPSRINTEGDNVRLEVESALKNGIPIIPVLVEGAPFPPAADLPSTLSGLGEFQQFFLGHGPVQANQLDYLCTRVRAYPRKSAPKAIAKPPTAKLPDHLERRFSWVKLILLGAISALLMTALNKINEISTAFQSMQGAPSAPLAAPHTPALSNTTPATVPKEQVSSELMPRVQDATADAAQGSNSAVSEIPSSQLCLRYSSMNAVTWRNAFMSSPQPGTWQVVVDPNTRDEAVAEASRKRFRMQFPMHDFEIIRTVGAVGEEPQYAVVIAAGLREAADAKMIATYARACNIASKPFIAAQR